MPIDGMRRGIGDAAIATQLDRCYVPGIEGVDAKAMTDAA